MALAASAAASSSLRAGQPAPHTMQHVPKIALPRSLGPCTAPARLPPPTRRQRAATAAALPARGMRPRRREPPAEREDDLLAQEPRDEMQLWKDRLAAMRPTERSAAVAQLLRIEEEGAFAGLVRGLSSRVCPCFSGASCNTLATPLAAVDCCALTGVSIQLACAPPSLLGRSCCSPAGGRLTWGGHR